MIVAWALYIIWVKIFDFFSFFPQICQYSAFLLFLFLTFAPCCLWRQLQNGAESSHWIIQLLTWNGRKMWTITLNKIFLVAVPGWCGRNVNNSAFAYLHKVKIECGARDRWLLDILDRAVNRILRKQCPKTAPTLTLCLKQILNWESASWCY